MSKLLFIPLTVLMLVACKKNNTCPYNDYAAELPYFSLSYGEDSAVEFNSAGIRVVTQNDGDTTNPHSSVTLMDNFLTFTIRLDVLDFSKEGQYTIDWRNGDVSLIKYGRSEIGRLSGNGYFVFVVARVDQGVMAGFYDGQLFNPLTGRLSRISGTFGNLRAR